MMIEHDIDNNERLPAPSDIHEYFKSPSIVNDRIEWAIRGHRDEFADILRSAWVIARQHRYLQRQLPILSVCVWSAAARGWSRAVAVCLRWGKTCRDICLQSVLHECRKASNILVSEVNAGVVDNDLKEMFLTRCLDLVVPHLAERWSTKPWRLPQLRRLQGLRRLRCAQRDTKCTPLSHAIGERRAPSGAIRCPRVRRGMNGITRSTSKGKGHLSHN